MWRKYRERVGVRATTRPEQLEGEGRWKEKKGNRKGEAERDKWEARGISNAWRGQACNLCAPYIDEGRGLKGHAASAAAPPECEKS